MTTLAPIRPTAPTASPPGDRPPAGLGLPTRRAAHAVRHWLTHRHGLWAEAAVIVVGYGLYDGSRGLVGSGRAVAIDHADDIAQAEQVLGIGVERSVAAAARTVPHLLDIFNAGYLTLHLTVTLLVLGWLWWTRSTFFPRVRTALLVASGLSLTTFLLFPAAPPRMAGLGLADTVSVGHVGLESGSLAPLYNPYAAFPSLHLAYATLVGVALVVAARRPWVRALGVAYPLFVAAEVVSTGNHFVLDLAGGVLVAAVGWLVATALERTAVPATAVAPAPAAMAEPCRPAPALLGGAGAATARSVTSAGPGALSAPRAGP